MRLYGEQGHFFHKEVFVDFLDKYPQNKITFFNRVNCNDCRNSWIKDYSAKFIVEALLKWRAYW